MIQLNPYTKPLNYSRIASLGITDHHDCAERLFWICPIVGHVTGHRSFTSSMRCSRELLQASRHRRVRLLAAFLALAPFALVLADARPPALLALAPFALVPADAPAPALLAFAPAALVLADARPPRTPCICSFGAGAGSCPPPRTPCICSFGAGAGLGGGGGMKGRRRNGSGLRSR
jgi:hypothetical protein